LLLLLIDETMSSVTGWLDGWLDIIAKFPVLYNNNKKKNEILHAA
jgi:hypothetical protein